MTILTNIINKDVFLLKKESSLFDFNDNSSNLQNTIDLRTFGPDFFNESIRHVGAGCCENYSKKDVNNWQNHVFACCGGTVFKIPC